MKYYIIVEDTDLSEIVGLPASVNKKNKEGYVCQGSPFIADGKYHQAMVLAK